MRRILFHISLLLLSASIKGQNTDSIITLQSLHQTISALAHDSMKGRSTGSLSMLYSAEYIAGRLKEAGVKPIAGNDGYFSYFEINNIRPYLKKAIGGINVMGAIKGKISPDTMVIFSAHYDHIGYMDFENGNDTIYNGANDDASGIATLIELSKYYKLKDNNRYSLVFVAFSGEELGLLGSHEFASTLNKKQVFAIINFDMLGRQMDENRQKAMVIGDNAHNIISKLNEQLKRGESFFIPDQYPKEQLMSRMDHYSFSGYKNCFSIVCSSPTDKYYHTVKDEISTIDFDFLLSATRNIAKSCEYFVR